MEPAIPWSCLPAGLRSAQPPLCLLTPRRRPKLVHCPLGVWGEAQIFFGGYHERTFQACRTRRRSPLSVPPVARSPRRSFSEEANNCVRGPRPPPHFSPIAE